MKPVKQKYYFIGKLSLKQLLKLDDMRARLLVCQDEAGKPYGFLVRMTPATITLLKKMNLI